MARWRPKRKAAEVEVPGWVRGDARRDTRPVEDPYVESDIVAAPDRGPRLSVSEALLGGGPQHPLQIGYDPCTYPDDPRLVGKAKKEPQPPESVPMDCEAEWERISAEQAWPDDLGYTI